MASFKEARVENLSAKLEERGKNEEALLTQMHDNQVSRLLLLQEFISRRNVPSWRRSCV